MKLSDHDLELVLQLYDRAKVHIVEKHRPQWAEDFVFTMEDFGISIRVAGKEIGEHDEYLDAAVEEFLENADEDVEGWYPDGDEWDE